MQDALLCTHVHPDGIAGALVQAAAVAALSLSTPAGEVMGNQNAGLVIVSRGGSAPGRSRGRAGAGGRRGGVAAVHASSRLPHQVEIRTFGTELSEASAPPGAP